MRPFFLACLAFVAIGAGGYFALDALQKPTAVAYTTVAVRIDPTWAWRLTSTTPAATSCQPRSSWQWFFVDFRDPHGESSLCSVSQ